MDISVSLASVSGKGQGVPKLTLDLAAESQTVARTGVVLAIINVTAAIWVTQDMTVHDESKSYFIGTGFLEPGGSQLNLTPKGSWKISIPLSPYQLQKIEEKRSGKALFLSVQFFCTAGSRVMPGATAALGVTASHPYIENIFCPSVGGGTSSDGYCHFRVAQSDWVQNLKELGYGDYVLCEIPLRGVPARVRLKKALTHLEDAWEHFSNGNDEETLVSCYKAFEFLAKQVKVKDPNDQAFAKILAGVEDEKKRKRLEQLMDYVCRFFALARHEEGQQPVSFNRKDSEYAVTLAQASLAYLAKSMSEESKIASRSLPQSK